MPAREMFETVSAIRNPNHPLGLRCGSLLFHASTANGGRALPAVHELLPSDVIKNGFCMQHNFRNARICGNLRLRRPQISKMLMTFAFIVHFMIRHFSNGRCLPSRPKAANFSRRLKRFSSGRPSRDDAAKGQNRSKAASTDASIYGMRRPRRGPSQRRHHAARLGKPDQFRWVGVRYGAMMLDSLTMATILSRATDFSAIILR